MSIFDESQHPRATDGEFATKLQSGPELALDGDISPWGKTAASMREAVERHGEGIAKVEFCFANGSFEPARCFAADGSECMTSVSLDFALSDLGHQAGSYEELFASPDFEVIPSGVGHRFVLTVGASDQVPAEAPAYAAFEAARMKVWDAQRAAQVAAVTALEEIVTGLVPTAVSIRLNFENDFDGAALRYESLLDADGQDIELDDEVTELLYERINSVGSVFEDYDAAKDYFDRDNEIGGRFWHVMTFPEAAAEPAV